MKSKEILESAGESKRQTRALLEREDYHESALNLAYSVALRRRDIRSLQDRLSKWGLSSLGKLEAKVLPHLDALLVVLAQLLDRELAEDQTINPDEIARINCGYDNSDT